MRGGKKKNPAIQDMENQFIETFGTKVELKGSLNKGKIEIHYYSMDDLDRILSIIKQEKT